MTNVKWKLGIIAGMIVAVFALYPQFKMIYLRGADWQGHYAYNDIDEVAYASYLRALIDGRPRKNDPYTGRDESPATPQPESLFSIQFAAPYAVAIPARIFGIGTPWAMTLAGAFAGFFLGLALFWVIVRFTGSSWFALMGSLLAVAGGAIAAGEGAIGEILDISISYPYFPGLRRYIPAIAIPSFFILAGAIWKTLGTAETRERVIFGGIAILSFAFSVYSYFYIWTMAAAWLLCLYILWILIRPDGFLKNIKVLSLIGFGCLLSLIPYAILLSRRAGSMDNVQLLVKTHSPDLIRFPIYIAAFAMLLLIVAVILKKLSIKDQKSIFALSFGLSVIAVFNQQVITGHSLQPIHYQVFIGNYVAALALILSIGLLLKDQLMRETFRSKIVLSVLTVLAVFWGFVECHYTVRVLDDANIERDRSLIVAKRLEDLARAEGFKTAHLKTVLSFGMTQADDLPSVAPQNVLWARHQHVFAGLSWQESKERYYQYLYYSNIDEQELADRLKNGDFVSMIALFGWGRHTSRLSSEATPLKYREIDEEAARYGEFRSRFSVMEASNPKISYLIVPQNWNRSIENIDRWYKRDNGEMLGDYVLFNLTLK